MPVAPTSSASVMERCPSSLEQQIEIDAKPSGALAQKFPKLRIRRVPTDRLGIPVVGQVETAERNLHRVVFTQCDAFGQAQIQREEGRKPRRVGDTGIVLPFVNPNVRKAGAVLHHWSSQPPAAPL